MTPFDLIRPALFALDPERAHRLTVAALRVLPAKTPAPDDLRLAVEAFGLRFPNPFGLAAGFDKGAEVPDSCLAQGFGFVEIGTVTPRPQPGNPRPRAFRLPEERAIINRYGFNSEGHAAVHARLAARRARGGIVGVNLGANKDSDDRAADYAAGVRAFADVASYFTINVSSPNTPGLRDLQAAATLDDLLARVLDARAANSRPVLLKIAPDLDDVALDDVVRVARARRVDGMIVANTTVTRPPALRGRAATEVGGLSGRPLFELSTRILAETARRVEKQFPIIGVGGVDSAATAWAKIEAGATLVQVYSALVFEGPGLIARLKRGVLERLGPGQNLAAVVGRSASGPMS